MIKRSLLATMLFVSALAVGQPGKSESGPQDLFWGTSWTSNPGDIISGLDIWYAGFSNSNYAKTSDEYTGTNGQVGPTITHHGFVIDGTQSSGGGNTSVILP